MALSFAAVEDLEVRWRTLSAGERETARVLMEDASALLRAEFPDIEQSVRNGILEPNVVAAVVAAMVKRAMMTPAAEGVSQETSSAGPYSHSRSFANPLGNVFLTAAERTMIVGQQPVVYTPKAMSVRFQ